MSIQRLFILVLQKLSFDLPQVYEKDQSVKIKTETVDDCWGSLTI